MKLPKVIAYRLNNIWYDEHDSVISIESVIQKIMNKSECFIKKATNSWGGMGVFYFNSDQREELISILNKLSGDIIVQEAIRQSRTLSTINADSVNTLRCLSLLSPDGTVKIYSTVLRMGIKGAKVDNSSSGGISVGVLENGKLKDVAYSNKGERFLEHPTSHVHFSDFVIPNYEDVKNLVKQAHPRFPHFRTISWDIAINEVDEPVLIEANFCDGELDFHQLNNGPIFGDDTEKILDVVFKH